MTLQSKILNSPNFTNPVGRRDNYLLMTDKETIEELELRIEELKQDIEGKDSRIEELEDWIDEAQYYLNKK
jgi:predicted RNase H-like nuclease (RuvC/YqgF family)